MASDRFGSIDGQVKTQLMNIEEYVSHIFSNPMLLLEALQFPGSPVRWNDFKDNTGLRTVGNYVMCLAAAAGEYRYSGLTDPGVMSEIPGSDWLNDIVWQRGMYTGLFDLMGISDGEAHLNLDTELLPLATAALVGALYMDGGMDAVENVVGDYAAYKARLDSSSGDADEG